jgi:hypothetical protein
MRVECGASERATQPAKGVPGTQARPETAMFLRGVHVPVAAEKDTGGGGEVEDTVGGGDGAGLRPDFSEVAASRVAERAASSGAPWRAPVYRHGC